MTHSGHAAMWEISFVTEKKLANPVSIGKIRKSLLALYLRREVKMLSYVGKTDHVKQKQANSYSSDMFSVKRSVYFPRITAPWRKLQHKLPLFKPEGSGFFT